MFFSPLDQNNYLQHGESIEAVVLPTIALTVMLNREPAVRVTEGQSRRRTPQPAEAVKQVPAQPGPQPNQIPPTARGEAKLSSA